MKKSMLSVGLFLGCFLSVFGQKTWFLSLEIAPAAKSQYSFLYSTTNFEAWSQPQLERNVSLGLGGRIFRQGNGLLQPEFGLEIRSFKNALTRFQSYFPAESRDQTIRQFSMVTDLGYRLEFPATKGGFRVSFGTNLSIWLPFMSKRTVFNASDQWINWYDEPQLGAGCGLNFGQELTSGRRLDFGFHFQKFFSPPYYFHLKNEFSLLKLRAGVSIDKVQKGS